VLGCVCVEAQGLMYDVYICVLPKQEKEVPDISPIPWFQQLARMSAVFLDSLLYLVSVRGASWFTLLIRPIYFVSPSRVWSLPD